MKINLGCGQQKLNGYIGVDMIKTEAVDVIHNLNDFPYPFEDGVAEEILLDNVLEHLDKPILVLEEAFRILKPRGIVKIYVPYFKSNSAFTDPTHKHFFSENSFKYFLTDNPLHYYTKANFKILNFKFINDRHEINGRHLIRRFLPFKKILNYFLFNIFDELYFELECIK